MDNTCSKTKSLVTFGTNIYVHMVFLFTILSLLFIFVISKMSEKALNNEVIDMLNENILNQYSYGLDEAEKLGVKTVLKGLPLETLSKYYSGEQQARKLNNDKVFEMIYMCVIIFIIIVILVVVVCKLLCFDIPIKRILVENIIIFSGIGLVEFLFFYFIILNYIPIEPSYIIEYMLSEVKKKLLS